MIENKFFNNSDKTLTGKPKFMPPQKRHLLESDTHLSSPQQSSLGKSVSEKKNPNNISRNITLEEAKQNTFSFKR